MSLMGDCWPTLTTAGRHPILVELALGNCLEVTGYFRQYASTHTHAFDRELTSIVLHIDDELTRRGGPERVAIGLTVVGRGSAGG